MALTDFFSAFCCLKRFLGKYLSPPQLLHYSLILLTVFPPSLYSNLARAEDEHIPPSPSEQEISSETFLKDEERALASPLLKAIESFSHEQSLQPDTNNLGILEQGLMHRQSIVEYEKKQIFESNVYAPTLQTWELSDIDVSLPENDPPEGALERSAIVRASKGGFEISFEGGEKYAHRFYFHGEDELEQVIKTSEYILVKSQKNFVYVIAVSGLQGAIFKNIIPAVPFGRLEDHISTSKDSNTLPLKLQMIKRRSKSLERTLLARESTLDKKEIWREYIIDVASSQSISRMEVEFEKLKPIVVAKELQEQIDSYSPENFILTDGDLAISRYNESSNSWEAIQIVPLPVVHEHILRFHEFLYAAVSFAKGDTQAAIQRVKEFQAEYISVIENTLSSPEKLKEAYQSSQLQKLARLNEKYLAFAHHSATNSLLEDGLRDQFSLQQSETDASYFQETLERSKESYLKHRWRFVPQILRRFYASAKHGVGIFDRRIISSVLKKTKTPALITASALTIDHLFLRQQGELLSYQFTSAAFQWIQNQFPILALKDYSPLLLKSVICQASAPILIMIAASIISPFTHFKPGELVVNFGIRSYGKYIVSSPIRLLATFTKQRASLEALKNGSLTGPLITESMVKKQNEKLKARNFKHSFAANLAILTVAARQGIEPGLLIQQIQEGNTASHEITTDSQQKPPPKFNVEAAIALSHELHFYLDTHFDLNTFLEITQGKEGSFNKVLEEAKIAAEKILDNPDLQSSTKLWLHHMKQTVLQDSFASIGNFQEDLRSKLIKAKADPFVVSAVMSPFFIDYWISIPAAALKGDWADPAHPERLHGQANGFAYSSNAVNTENFQQIPGHLMSGATTVYLELNQDHTTSNLQHRPSHLSELEEKQNYRKKALWKDIYDFTFMSLNLRAFDGFKTMENIFYRGRFTLFHASMITSVLPRVLFGGMSFREGSMGALAYLFSCSLVYGWWWAYYYSTKANYEKSFEPNKQKFFEAQEKLSISIERKNEAEAKIASRQLEELYAKSEFRDLPKMVFTPLPGEETWTFYQRLLDYSCKHHAFPIGPTKVIDVFSLGLVSSVTTVIGTYLFTATMRPDITLLGANLSDWNLFIGIPEGDGIVSITIKSMIILRLMRMAKALFDYTNDSLYLNIPALRRQLIENGELEQVETNLQEAKKELHYLNPVRSIKNIASKTYQYLRGPTKKALRDLKSSEKYNMNKETMNPSKQCSDMFDEAS